MQRSVQAGRKGLTEDKYDDLLHFADSPKFTEREKVALTLGQQRWIKTLGIGHHEVLADTSVGLAPSVEARGGT